MLLQSLQYAAAALPLTLATAFPAWADDVIASSSDVLAAEPWGGPDLVVSIFFTGVVALLTIVTAGVLYLGIMQALDKKQEMDDKQSQGSRLKAAPGTKAPAAKAEEEELAASGRRVMKVKRDKTKGFGSGDV